MADFSKLINEKDKSAKYMVDEITHICKDMPKRDPGSEGERIACEYMADVLAKDCGCENVTVESFKENPGSFYGWLYVTITCILLSIVTLFFAPIASIVLIAFGLLVCILQFGLYIKFLDKLFPEKTGTNVTAIKKCTGEVKGRIFFNGHPDAAWNWPMNKLGGGILFEGHAVIGFLGAFYYLGLSIAALCSGFMSGMLTPEVVGPLNTIFWCGIGGLAFVPFLVLLYRMWDKHTVVDGANDNLTGCYMGIAILKAMKDEGIELEHTEVGVILTGSEEAGLRGAKAWAEAHKDDYKDVPTWIYSYDTIHDAKQLMANYRNLNGTVKSDKEVTDSFVNAAKELDIFCKKGWVPPLGGATDDAAFTQAGFRATGITGLNHKLESYYHTTKDSYDNLSEDGLAKCYAVSVKCLENFDKNISNAD